MFPTGKNWSKEKIEEDRTNLVKLLNIDKDEALRIVLHGHLRGVLTKEKRLLHHARLYLQEQRAVLKIVTLLFSYRREPPAHLSPEYLEIANNYSAEVMADPDLFSGIVKAIESNFKNPFFLESDDDNLSALFVKECLLFQIDLLNLLLVGVLTVLPSDSLLIDSWVNSIEATNHFTYPSYPILENETGLIKIINSLTTTITLAFFDFDQDFSIEGASPNSYINNPDILLKLHKNFNTLLSSQPSASPIVLGWSFILNIIAARLGEVPNSKFDKFFAEVIPDNIPKVTRDSQRIPDYEILMLLASDMAQSALRIDPFEILQDIYEIFPELPIYSSTFVSYLKASLPYVSLTETLATFVSSVCKFPEQAEKVFVDTFGDRLFTLATLRFPTAMHPFLKFSQSLGENAYDAVSQLYTFMQPFPKDFQDYKVIGGSASVVELTREISLLPSIEKVKQADFGPIVLPPGTRGEIHVINHARYIIWKFNYNGWSFLGSLLERNYIISNYNIGETPSYDENTSSIIDLLTNTISSIEDDQKAFHLLTMTSECLRDSDIIDLIFKILEDAIFAKNISLSTSCVKFVSTICLLLPDRVWSYLGRSSMLERNGIPSSIATILGLTEHVSGKYDLTIAILNMIKTLLPVSLQSLLISQVSSKIRSEVIAQLVRHTLTIFESFAYRSYIDSRQKVEIALQCVNIFNTVLSYSFDIDETSALNKKITSILAPATEYLVQQLLTPEQVIPRALKPLVGSLEHSAMSVTSLDTDYPLEPMESLWLYSSLNFASTLVKARTLLNMAPSQLEKTLFSFSLHLSILYSRYPQLRPVIMEIFISIIKAPWPSSEQPSLLAHLGKYAHMFISNLTGSLENRLENEYTVMKVASCFSTIIEGQQEGLSILLLTGRDTRKASQVEQQVTSLLQVTENRVSSSNTIPSEILLPLLRSMASAYSNWKLGTFSSNPELAASLLKIVDNCFQLCNSTEQNESDPLEYANSLAIAAQALLIFSVQVYKSPDGPGIQKFIQYLQEKNNMINISKKFLEISKLNSKQHEDLFENFDFRWPQCGGLRKFAKSNFEVLDFGPSYIFDIQLLDLILGTQESWIGFRNEVIAENITFSKLHAQLQLVNAWCSFNTSLAICYSNKLKKINTEVNQYSKVLKMLDKVADICLEKVSEEEYSVPVLSAPIQSRIALMFTIKLQISRRKLSNDTFSTLSSIYNILSSPDYKFIEAISNDGKQESSDKSYRLLLRALIISLDGLKSVSENSFQILQIIYGIFCNIIIRGMSAAVQAALSNPDCGADVDMVLIISILRKCLAVDGVKSLYPKVASVLFETQCTKLVMGLYSYAQSLSTGNDDLAYGELALFYLLEWLNVSQIADQLINNGILDSLMESPTSLKIREGGVTPTTNPQLHTLWIKGILPILLVLLQNVGSRIVGDILIIINFFSEQIQSSFDSWSNPTEISTSTITETTQLLLLVDILGKFSSNPDAIKNNLKGTIPLSEDLIGSIDYLLSHPRFLNASLVATSPEEQRLFLIEDSSSTPDGNKLLTLVQDELRDLRDLLNKIDIRGDESD